MQSGRLDGGAGEEVWGMQPDTKDVAAALDVRGICEGPLKKSIAAAFPTTGISSALMSLCHVLLADFLFPEMLAVYVPKAS